MFAAIGLMACPHLAVPADVMSHIVDVESGANPYAIGVVGGQLQRQPKNLAEALATVRMLDTKGYNYSLGVAQVNRANLGKYGLDSYQKAFDACLNLAAGAKILAACYAGAGGDWGKAFSCYYSGNFTTGFRDGYVQKVYASIHLGHVASTGGNPAAIPLKASNGSGSGKATPVLTDAPGYRVAIRSVKLDTVEALAARSSLGSSANRDASVLPAGASTTPSGQTAARATLPVQASRQTRAAAIAQSAVFVPQVTGPNDHLGQSANAPTATPLAAATTMPNTHLAPVQEVRDNAFVF